MFWCLMLGGRAPRPDREPYTRRAMADKVDKPKKKAKPKKDEKGVLAALPATRPERIGSRRAEPAARRARAKPASNGAKAAAGKPATAAKAAGTKRASAKTAARPSSSRATAARPKAAAPHTFEPTQAAESAAKAEAPSPRPRPVSEGAPGIGTGATAPDERSPESARPSGIELASTAVRAAGEVAQLGITIGGHLLKRAVERLPRP
jgi:hypothetical protein